MDQRIGLCIEDLSSRFNATFERTQKCWTASLPRCEPLSGVIRPLHSVENPLLDLNSGLGRKLVYGSDGDLIAELPKGSRQHLGTFLLFPGTHSAALLDKSHSFMQDLPNYTTEPMGNGPDGGLIA